MMTLEIKSHYRHWINFANGPGIMTSRFDIARQKYVLLQFEFVDKFNLGDSKTQKGIMVFQVLVQVLYD